MNRRTLCKVVVAMGLLTAVHPLKQLAAAEAPDTEKPSEPPEVLHQAKPRLSVCACRPRLPNGGVTFLKKRQPHG
ncbi:MAG: hypothetical protein AABZ34_13005 [Nitrospirota bacterium]